VLPPERGFSDEPYRQNAPGPFYVGAGECMTCGAPHVVAPDLMAWAYDASLQPVHCYFRKQPATPDELERAAKAIDVSCCGALRYSGDDREIKKRLGI